MRAVFVEQADPTAPLSALRVGERPEQIGRAHV